MEGSFAAMISISFLEWEMQVRCAMASIRVLCFMTPVSAAVLKEAEPMGECVTDTKEGFKGISSRTAAYSCLVSAGVLGGKNSKEKIFPARFLSMSIIFMYVKF